jgi:AcrR family transcriptional regulator
VVRESNARSIHGQPGRRARRHDARRADILRAAARVFRRHGFADAGMRAIADEADLSPANLYHYFRGKDELLYYCQDQALDRMLGVVAAARRARVSALARLEQILTAHATILLDDVEGATAHVQVDALPPARRARLVAKRDRYERAVRAVVERGLDAGEFVVEDAAVVTRAMLGAINWTAMWFRPGGAHDASHVGAVIARFLVRGMARTPGGPSSPSRTRHARATRSLRSL